MGVFHCVVVVWHEHNFDEFISLNISGMSFCHVSERYCSVDRNVDTRGCMLNDVVVVCLNSAYGRRGHSRCAAQSRLLRVLSATRNCARHVARLMVTVAVGSYNSCCDIYR